MKIFTTIRLGINKYKDNDNCSYRDILSHCDGGRIVFLAKRLSFSDIENILEYPECENESDVMFDEVHLFRKSRTLEFQLTFYYNSLQELSDAIKRFTNERWFLVEDSSISDTQDLIVDSSDHWVCPNCKTKYQFELEMPLIWSRITYCCNTHYSLRNFTD